ncbi:ubiquinone biosynthesis accessory factor UbiJ [Polaromonas sp. DSR2-3-2]|uniref:ubiquinone biosynthesis accessory factor UbiJ n=1 Tax=unclassified Polaromonas TaxID=2638319 RepID=UPI003CEFF60C
MNNTSPFSFLESIATRFQPPAWVVDEGQQRLVLFLNHVLLQEKQAQERLLRQKGRVVHLRWGLFAIDLIVTPAGLADRAPAFSTPDLVLSVAAESPLAVAQSVLAGKTPPVKIEGDVQLAADIGWLAENLRWDAEEDLSRLIGDAPAHALADAGRRLATGLRQFLTKGPLAPAAQAATSSPAAPAGAVPPRRTAPVAPLSQVSAISPLPAETAAVPAGSAVQSDTTGDPLPSGETSTHGSTGEVPSKPPGAAA